MGSLGQILGSKELPAQVEDLGGGRWRMVRRILLQSAGNLEDGLFGQLGEALEDEYELRGDEARFADLILVDQSFGSDIVNRASAVVLTKVYETVGEGLLQVGDVECGVGDERAFVGTAAGGGVLVGTRFAREWRIRYVIRGDVSGDDAVWPAVNSTRLFGGKTGYFTGGGVVVKNGGYSFLDYRYNELPSRLVYNEVGSYTFPGKLGYSSDMGVYEAEPSTTRQVSFEMDETYSVGEVGADALGYEPIYWAQGVVSYTRDTGESGAKAFNFPGVIGFRSVGLTNKVFAGALCSTVNGTVTSSPSTYPTGKRLIRSSVAPWKGNIWKKTNVFLTFPV